MERGRSESIWYYLNDSANVVSDNNLVSVSRRDIEAVELYQDAREEAAPRILEARSFRYDRAKLEGSGGRLAISDQAPHLRRYESAGDGGDCLIKGAHRLRSWCP